MKNFNVRNKFKSLYYIGLSVIVGIAFVVFLLLSVISGVIIKSFDNHNHDDIEKVEKVSDVKDNKETNKKVLVYDTIKVQVYDTIKPKPKKIKPMVIIPEKPDSLK